MTDEKNDDGNITDGDEACNDKKSANPKRVVSVLGIVIVLLFAVIVVLAKNRTFLGTVVQPESSANISQAESGDKIASGSLTSTHNDATADYAAALKAGKPIYVLFHSLTCDPCVEISAIAEKVMPDYRNQIVFVNAITDDASGQALATEFAFQYIPTSFFVDPDGQVVDSYTGVLSESRMRSQLDTLVKSK